MPYFHYDNGLQNIILYILQLKMGKKGQKKRSKQSTNEETVEASGHEDVIQIHDPEADAWMQSIADDEPINLTASELRRLIADNYAAGKRDALKEHNDATIEEYVPMPVTSTPIQNIVYVPRPLKADTVATINEELDTSVSHDEKSFESIDQTDPQRQVSNDLDVINETEAMAALSVESNEAYEAERGNEPDHSKGAIPKRLEASASPQMGDGVDSAIERFEINDDHEFKAV